MDKKKRGSIFGVASVLTVLVSVIFFYIERGPNANFYFMTIVLSTSSIIGILFSVFSWLLSKHLILLIIGVLSNGAVLVFAYLLLIAMGISQP